MRVDAIEEDNKFIPPQALKTYTEAERAYLPDVPGYGWTQILDQLNERVNATKSGFKFRVFIKAHGGSVLWLLKHLETSGVSYEAYVKLTAGKKSDPFVVEEIRRFSAVRMELPPASELFEELDCLVLLPRNPKDLLSSVTGWLPSGKPIIAWDPGRFLKDYGGRYFLNSKVWVKL